MAAFREPLPKNHRLILFQRAKSDDSARFIEEKKKRKGPESVEALTGDEAKSFYEDIIASSSVADDDSASNPGGACVAKTSHSSSQRHRKRRKQSSRHHENTSKGKETVTTATVSAFLRFAQDGDLEGVEKCLSLGGVDVNATDAFNWTALMCASFAGHRSVVRCLLEHGAEWREQIDSRGRNAVDLARKAGHRNIVDLFQEFSNNGGFLDNAAVAMDAQGPNQDQNGYFCEVCQQEFKETSQEDHEHSTVHLFNCKHAPASTMYFLPESNRGFQMMLREGWDKEEGLGRDGRKGQKFPVKTVLKRDRTGLGARQDYRAKVTHFSSRDTKAVKRPRESEKKMRRGTLSRRERAAKERKEKQWERNFRASFNTDF